MVRGPDAVLTRRWAPRLVVLAALTLPLFVTGIPLVPHTGVEALLYDVVLFNAAYVPAAVACWLAARRVRTERLAWRALGLR